MNKTVLKIAVSGDVCANVLTWRTFKKTTKRLNGKIHRMFTVLLKKEERYYYLNL